MNLKRSWLAVPAALALALTACGGNSGSSESAESGAPAAGASDAIITTNGVEPENPLIPTNTNEVGGGKILDLIFAGLVYYDAKGASHNDMAESIETDDNVTWTIKIKPGQKFTDGTEVKAENFTKAWEAGYQGDHFSAYFFEPIEGYTLDEEGKRVEGSTLSGLTVVDDHTFTVKLKQPESDFAGRLGYSAFFPLPDSTLADPEKGGAEPVGNGPYKLASASDWEHDVQITLTANPDYKGDRAPKNGGVQIKFYESQDAAYADLLANNVDVIDAIPDSAFATYQSDLPERNFNQPSAIFQSFTIPQNLAHFSGEEGILRREAIAMAFDREEITKTIFQGTRTPAKDFTSPVINGWNDHLEGADVLTYNPEKAKELWAKADAISPWEGTFTIAYNSDGGHQTWVDAVTNAIKNTLGIKAEGKAYPTFKELRKDVNARTITGAFRSGWQADYPGLYNFLAPLYATGGGSNDGDYSNPKFDETLKKAAAAATPEENIKFLDEAQAILFKDLPAIPLWYSNVTGGWSENVSNVEVGWNSVPLYENITKK